MSESDDRNQDQRSSDGSGENGSSSQQSSSSPPKSGQKPPPTLLEWAVRALSAAVILGLTGYILWTAFQPVVDPYFEFEIKSDEITQRGGSWVVPVSVKNAGTQAIEGIELTLQVVDGEEVVEESALTLALLGGGESADGEFWLSANPHRYRLEPTVVAYRLP